MLYDVRIDGDGQQVEVFDDSGRSIFRVRPYGGGKATSGQVDEAAQKLYLNQDNGTGIYDMRTGGFDGWKM